MKKKLLDTYNIALNYLKNDKYAKFFILFIVISILFINLNLIYEKSLSIKVNEVSPITFLANKDDIYQNQEMIKNEKEAYLKEPEIFYIYSEEGEKWIKDDLTKFQTIVSDINKIKTNTGTENLYSTLRDYALKNEIDFDLVVAINNVNMSSNDVSSLEEKLLSFVRANGGILENEIEDKKGEMKGYTDNFIEHPIIREHFYTLIDENLVATKITDAIRTAEAKQNKFHQIEQNHSVEFKAGQKIVGKNEIITQQHYDILKYFGLLSNNFQLEKYLKLNIIYVILMIGLFFTTRVVKELYSSGTKMLLLGILFSIGTLTISVSLMFEIFSTHLLLFLPLILILTDVFISKRITVFMNIIYATLIIYITSDISLMLSYLLVCLIITLLIRNIENRSDMIKIGVYATFLTVVIMLLIDNSDNFGYFEYLLMAFNVLFSFFISTPAFTMIERRCNILTPFSLMELQQHKILDRLNEEAPGTMIHSRNVAHLAKNAALKINADHNLLYTGALLHDIGKLHDAKMFTENHPHFQLKYNPMDKLTPIDGAIVIKRHVEYGIELAKELKLPKSIIDLIRTHHGESTIKYFYFKAKSSADKSKKTTPSEEDFKYKWGKPQTKEQGILMLCDVAEAVSKSFDDYSREYLADRLPKYLKEIMDDGQLDECDLTLNEFNLVLESIIDSLVSLNLKRTKYQNQKD